MNFDVDFTDEQLLLTTSDEYSRLLDMADAFVTEGRSDMGKDRALDG